MNVEFEIKLIEALDALDHGEPLDAILARYPESAADLRPMLSTTAALPTLRMQPSEAQKMKSRQAFLKQGAALRQASQRRTKLGFVPRLATMFAAFSVAFAVFGGGAVAASGSALPGDPLYGLKLTVENARLTFTVDTAARTALQAQFDQQRRREANALLDAGRETEVQFSGPIESIQPDAWVIGGLVVRIDANTQINGRPQIDRLANVRGLTGRTGLRALVITLEQTAEPTPEVPTATPEPTDTPAPTATPNPIVTPEPTEPRPTREPPTATPVPPKPVSIEFTGSVNNQTATSWIIDGATVVIDANTVFKGNIGVGQRVKVQALRYANGRLLATQIELLSDGGGGGGGDNGQNGNSNDNGGSDNNRNSNDDQNDHNDNHNSNDDNHNNDNKNSNDDNHNSNDNHK
jgi:hypothetical protein